MQHKDFTPTQFFGIVIVMVLMVAYFVTDSTPIQNVPMVDETITHHSPEDIPQLDKDGL